MHNRLLLHLLLVAICLNLALEVSSQNGKKAKVTSNSTAKDKKVSRTTPKPGFFRTLFSVVYEQYQDTRNTIQNVNKLVDGNFLPENYTTTTPVPGSNASTTEDTRISRSEFNKILMRNFRGLQKLYQIELSDALKQSEKNYNAFRKNVTKEIGKFL